MHTLNFFFHGTAASVPHWSHTLWARQACRFYADYLGDVPVRTHRRTNVVARRLKKKPASKQDLEETCFKAGPEEASCMLVSGMHRFVGAAAKSNPSAETLTVR